VRVLLVTKPFSLDLANISAPTTSSGMTAKGARITVGWQYIIATIAAVIYILAPAFLYPVDVQDEGFAVYGAMRVLNGDVPYRDFLIEYPPGIFYMLASAFKIFGATLIVERMCDASIRIIIALLVYLIARKLSSHTLAMASCASTVLLLGSCGFFGYAVFPAVAFSLASALTVMLFMERGKPIWLLVSGCMTGVAALFRHDFGFYTFVPVVFVLALFCLYTPPRADRQNASRSKMIASSWLLYVLGTILIVGPVIAYFAATVPARDLWFDLIGYHVELDHNVSALPIPAPLPNMAQAIAGEQTFTNYLLSIKREWLPFYSPLLIYVLFLIVLASGVVRRGERGPGDSLRMWGGLLVTSIGLLYYAQPWNRNDHIHRVPTLLIASIVLVTIASKKDHLSGLLKAMLMCLVAVVSIVLVYHPLVTWHGNVISNKDASCDVEKARYLRCTNPNQQDAVRFIDTNVSPSDKIFVGNVQHSQICGYDLLFYFLTDRRSGTKFANLLSGVTNTLDIQQQIVKDLDRNQVAWVVLYSGAQNCPEQNGSQADSGVHVLDDFIRDRFQFVRQDGLYEIWTRANQARAGKGWESP
jgi:hypothetical protein